MARVEVPMPQMGESIAEGTVSRWLKEVGDDVERDEPILEISTDKVDAEIPAPSAGTLVEVAVEEGETVEVGTIVAYIETEKGAAPATAEDDSADGAEDDADDDAEEGAEEKAAIAATAAEEPSEAGEAEEAEEAAEPARRKPAAATATAERGAGAGDGARAGGPQTAEERLKQRSTPLVRRIAAEHGVEISAIEGTGRSGRVTKQDILGFLEQQEKAPAEPEKPERAAAPEATEPAPAPAAPPREAAASLTAEEFHRIYHTKVLHPEFPQRENDRVESMTRIRQLTADHMVRAKRIAPHVHSFIEIDFTRVDRLRRENKAAWEEQGVKVSYTAFVAWAAARALREFPMVNGTVSGENLLYRGDINIGIAVDLNPGLIVPVIRNAEELTLVGISKRIIDLAGRARERKLKPDEIQGATFSITNPGVLGTYVGMPVIPEGTSAILGTGAIEKRPVVVDVNGSDAIVIQKRSMFSLGYDHRIVDGADAARFLALLKEIMQDFPEEAM